MDKNSNLIPINKQGLSKLSFFKKASMLLFLVLLVQVGAYAASFKVTGTVKSATDNSLIPGVSIQEKGTKVGTVTGINGEFTINVASPDAVLVFSYVGYETKEVPVNGQSNLDVVISETSASLDQVVVVGYGVQKKSLVTGAISSVSSSDISNSVNRAEQALQGKAAGVTVLTTSGAPGAAINVRVRGTGTNGNSNPLYIVDGMKVGDINFLNPSDIESMEVLKDAASSAIYGTEGANGVVIVKTKGGKKGGDGIVEYSFQYGVQSMPDVPELMNAYQYAEFMKEGHAATFPNLPNPAQYKSNPAGTNWFKAIEDKNSPMYKHNLQFSGGGEKSSYLTSIGYQSQDGIIGGSKASYERITTRFNGNYDVKPWLEVGTTVNYSHSKRHPLTEFDAFNGEVNSAMLMDPTVPTVYSKDNIPTWVQSLIASGTALKKDKNGNYYGVSNFLTGEPINPLIRLSNQHGVLKEDRLNTTGFINLKPIKGLVLTSRAGLELIYQNFSSWSPVYYANPMSLNSTASVNENFNQWQNILWENFASYNFKIQDNNITLLAGTSVQQNLYNFLNTTSGSMIKEDPLFSYPDYVDSRANDLIGGHPTKTHMLSYYGRLSYDYKGRYMLEATFRRDGSSLFGSDNRWGNFPSVSGGWVVTNESFWNIKPIEYLKLRASWGKNGSVSNLTPDQFRSLISTVGITYPDASGSLLPGAEPALLANPKLKWETSEQTDVGVDFRIMNSLIYGNIDYFYKKTKNLLTPSTPAPSLGNYAPFMNAGNVENKGLEILVGSRKQISDFRYDVSATFTFQRNKVLSLSENLTSLAGATLPTLGAVSYFEVGQPVWYFKGYKVDGIFKDQAQIDAWKKSNGITDVNFNPQPGDPIVANVNKDNTINEEDMTKIGSPQPKFIYGVNINLGYKSIDFNLFGQGVAGNDVFMGFCRADNSETNKISMFYNNRWVAGADNSNATMPRAGYNNVLLYKSSLLVGNGSYFKIRQIELGYTLPTNLTNMVKISKLRVYASLNDYFTFTKYKGFDPEVGAPNPNQQGIDFGTYPVSKKILFGLNVTF